MSDTPRTDALPRIRQAGATEYVPIEDCRQLERELAEAREEISDLQGDVEAWKRETMIANARLRGEKHPDDNGAISPKEIIPKLQRELAEAQNTLKQCLSIMPVGYVPTHTVENIPEMIGDLAKALAEETTEREQLERELAEARSMTAGQWLLKVATRLVTAGCKSDGIVDAMDELIQQRDTLAEALEMVTTHNPVDNQCDNGFSPRYVAKQALAAVKGGAA
jgi:predicted RNase H-like nuclease (RuvC/YqgF family)